MHELFSIIIATYNTVLSKIYMTLDSVLQQEYKNIEILIADDGSVNNHFPEIECYFRKQNFDNYKLLSDGINRGTVENIFRAIETAKGTYVKLIGGGDLLFSRYTLNTVYNFMATNKSKLIFGNMEKYQKEKGGTLHTDIYINPKDIKAFMNKNRLQCKKNIIIYGKFISGASLFFERQTLIELLNKIRGTVIYCEDLIQVLALLDNINIDYIPQNLIWYEYGEGISTSNSSKWKQLIANDHNNFLFYLKENYYKDKFVQQLIKRKSFERYNYLRGLFKLFCFPGMFFADIKTKFQVWNGLYCAENTTGFLNERK